MRVVSRESHGWMTTPSSVQGQTRASGPGASPAFDDKDENTRASSGKARRA